MTSVSVSDVNSAPSLTCVARRTVKIKVAACRHRAPKTRAALGSW